MRRKRKKEFMSLDDKLNDFALLMANEEIKEEKKVSIGTQSVSIPIYQKRIEFYEYDFLKSYVYSVHTGVLSDSEVVILTLNTPVSGINQALMPPNIIFDNENSIPSIGNDTVHINLYYKNCSYQLTVSCISSGDGFHIQNQFFISVSGNEAKANYCSALSDYLIKQAVKNSRYKNKILKLYWDYENRLIITEYNNAEFKSENFESLFLPQKIKSELLRFVDSVKYYSNTNNLNGSNTSLRFLCSGPPGTGKTKSIRTIINNCFGHTTIILPEGMVNFTTLFSFATIFPNSLICLDDIDLIFGDRYQNYSPSNLIDFLTTMDGLVKNSVFLLGSTNDKELVDSAARRPGRFDMVLDFKELDRQNYSDLIKSNTDDIEIINLFDFDAIEMFGRKKLPGSFVVNIIKQLKITKELYPNSNLKEYLDEYFKFSYEGFYKNNAKEQDKLGFM